MEFEEREIFEKKFTLSSMLADVVDLRNNRTKQRLYVKGIFKKDRVSNFENVEKLDEGRGEWEVEGIERVKITEVNYISDQGETHKMPYSRFVDLGMKDEIYVNQAQSTEYR